MNKTQSPCICCSRVADPRKCDNKNCPVWQKWFIARWEALRSDVRAAMDLHPEPVGVTVSGKTYAAPHQVQAYLDKDPCGECMCPRELCHVPCKMKANWLAARKDVLF